MYMTFTFLEENSKGRSIEELPKTTKRQSGRFLHIPSIIFSVSAFIPPQLPFMPHASTMMSFVMFAGLSFSVDTCSVVKKSRKLAFEQTISSQRTKKAKNIAPNTNFMAVFIRRFTFFSRFFTIMHTQFTL